MLTTANIFFISAFVCAIMLMVWRSLLRTEIAGIREWMAVNALGLTANLLYGFGRDLPPWLAYEAANGAYAAATLAALIGFKRIFGRPVSWALYGTALALLVAMMALFHYWDDSYAMRATVMALFQTAVCSAIIRTVYPLRKNARSAYPSLFTITIALVVVAGHILRATLHLSNPGEANSLLQPSAWNLFFLSAGSMALPAMTLGALLMVHDTMLARAEHAANRDFLTGAWSRRAFFELSERELIRTRRAGEPLALLLLDVDHFKQINDSCGHATGDQVLMDMTLRVETVIRSIDYFARIGGEEFALLLPGADRASAMIVAERLRAVLASDGGRQSLPGYTVSIGLAVQRDSDSLQEMLRRADAALYQAKASGRNQVIGESVL